MVAIDPNDKRRRSLTAANCAPRGYELPSELLAKVAMAQFGVSRAEAEAFNENLRAERLGERGDG